MTLEQALRKTSKIMGEVSDAGGSAETRLLAAAVKTLADIATAQEIKIASLEKTIGLRR